MGDLGTGSASGTPLARSGGLERLFGPGNALSDVLIPSVPTLYPGGGVEPPRNLTRARTALVVGRVRVQNLFGHPHNLTNEAAKR